MYAQTEKEVQAAIVWRLDTNPKSVMWALLAVYANQTADEQVVEATKHNNGRGFTGSDAPFMSSVAKKAQQYGSLTERQVMFTRKNLYKYWRQIWEALKAAGKTQIEKAPDGYVSPYRKLTTVASVFEEERKMAALVQQAEREEEERVAAFKMRRDEELEQVARRNLRADASELDYQRASRGA